MEIENKGWKIYQIILGVIVIILIITACVLKVTMKKDEEYYNEKNILDKKDALILGENKYSNFLFFTTGREILINDYLISSDFNGKVNCDYYSDDSIDGYYCYYDNLDDVFNKLFYKEIDKKSIFTYNVSGEGISLKDNNYVDYFDDRNYYSMENVKLTVKSIRENYIEYNASYDLFNNELGLVEKNENDIFSIIKEDNTWKIKEGSFLTWSGKIKI